ncbi:MAG: hypothetical protein QNJ90_09235 [Planctomycetota bacterium]|nr:hypothetical protein [Planctomycetota bacterium]
MSNALPVHRLLRMLGVLLLGLACACESPTGGGLDRELAWQPAPMQADRPPLARRDGPRLPAFSGGDPRARGWMKVDDLLWIDRRDEEAYRSGLVFDGVSYVSVDAAPTRRVRAESGFRLRTDHLAVHTNAPWRQALEIAREAEAHVRRLVGDHGETLDLRLPEGPLKVVVTQTRAEFEETLRTLVRDPVGWGAFYDARSGNVYISLEPARRGPLPWRADLRHEMTHQLMDLSRPPSRRGRAFARPWFWLWEGVAIWAEELGGPSGALEKRTERFRKHLAWGDATPLDGLLALGPRTYEGRHYDQTASLMSFLVDPASPQRGARVLALVGTLQRGHVPLDALEEATGMSMQQLERSWLAAARR